MHEQQEKKNLQKAKKIRESRQRDCLEQRILS